MRKLLLGGITAAILLLGGHASAENTEEYVGTVNHVFDDQTLRIAYRYGGQIQVRIVGLDGTAETVLLDDLLGRTVRIVDARWRDGFLEGRLNLESVN